MQCKLLILATLAVAVLPRLVSAQVDAQDVTEALERGVEYLRREQSAKGAWAEYPGNPAAMTALCTLAMLNAGVPADDPAIVAALDHLRPVVPERTYAIALQTMVFCLAEPNNTPLIRRNAKKLSALQRRDGTMKGAWGYPSPPEDNSNSQFALLALHEAERVGVVVSEKTWRLAYDYWQQTQNDDGSWGYHLGSPGTASMTCAGIAAMIIAGDKLNNGDARAQGDQIRCCGQQADNSAVKNGLQWLARNFSVQTNIGEGRWLLYYLYGLERVGRLTNQRLIGGHDWYREGAEMLVADQFDTGEWQGPMFPENHAHLGTSLSLLFLAKGRRPVVIGKLRHEPLEDWNHHRSDVANLTLYAEKRWGRELTWQTVDPRNVPADELLEALLEIPVLYLSGALDPEFTDEQVRILRQYVDRGGFILAESCCQGDGFDTAFRKLAERMFPEPEYKLSLLPPEHLIWNAEEPVPAEFVRPLYGIDIGCRTSVVYCPDNQQGSGRLSLSCYWELARPGRTQALAPAVQQQVDAARGIGINILAYATNREIKFKLDGSAAVAAATGQDQFERAKLYIAKIQHPGAWNAAPAALANLLRVVSQQAGLRASTDEKQLPFSDPKVFDYHLVFMHGRTDFSLTEEERKQLRAYVERGGTIFADSICASEAFTKAFRRELAVIFPDQPLAAIPGSDPLFTTEFGGFDLKQVQRRDQERRGDDGPVRNAVQTVEPELEGLAWEGRYAVIFSRFDISCALERHESLECPGYIRADAAKIGLNVVLYSLHK